MRMQHTCVCGSKMVIITEEFDKPGAVLLAEQKFRQFHERHASCVKIINGIHPSQKVNQCK